MFYLYSVFCYFLFFGSWLIVGESGLFITPVYGDIESEEDNVEKNYPFQKFQNREENSNFNRNYYPFEYPLLQNIEGNYLKNYPFKNYQSKHFNKAGNFERNLAPNFEVKNDLISGMFISPNEPVSVDLLPLPEIEYIPDNENIICTKNSHEVACYVISQAAHVTKIPNYENDLWTQMVLAQFLNTQPKLHCSSTLINDKNNLNTKLFRESILATGNVANFDQTLPFNNGIQQIPGKNSFPKETSLATGKIENFDQTQLFDDSGIKQTFGETLPLFEEITSTTAEKVITNSNNMVAFNCGSPQITDKNASPLEIFQNLVATGKQNINSRERQKSNCNSKHISENTVLPKELRKESISTKENTIQNYSNQQILGAFPINTSEESASDTEKSISNFSLQRKSSTIPSVELIELASVTEANNENILSSTKKLDTNYKDDNQSKNRNQVSESVGVVSATTESNVEIEYTTQVSNKLPKTLKIPKTEIENIINNLSGLRDILRVADMYETFQKNVEKLGTYMNQQRSISSNTNSRPHIRTLTFDALKSIKNQMADSDGYLSVTTESNLENEAATTENANSIVQSSKSETRRKLNGTTEGYLGSTSPDLIDLSTTENSLNLGKNSDNQRRAMSQRTVATEPIFLETNDKEATNENIDNQKLVGKSDENENENEKYVENSMSGASRRSISRITNSVQLISTNPCKTNNDNSFIHSSVIVQRPLSFRHTSELANTKIMDGTDYARRGLNLNNLESTSPDTIDLSTTVNSLLDQKSDNQRRAMPQYLETTTSIIEANNIETFSENIDSQKVTVISDETHNLHEKNDANFMQGVSRRSFSRNADSVQLVSTNPNITNNDNSFIHSNVIVQKPLDFRHSSELADSKIIEITDFTRNGLNLNNLELTTNKFSYQQDNSKMEYTTEGIENSEDFTEKIDLDELNWKILETSTEKSEETHTDDSKTFYTTERSEDIERDLEFILQKSKTRRSKQTIKIEALTDLDQQNKPNLNGSVESAQNRKNLDSFEPSLSPALEGLQTTTDDPSKIVLEHYNNTKSESELENAQLVLTAENTTSLQEMNLNMVRLKYMPFQPKLSTIEEKTNIADPESLNLESNVDDKHLDAHVIFTLHNNDCKKRTNSFDKNTKVNGILKMLALNKRSMYKILTDNSNNVLLINEN
ncbi:putative uncharacterized protein DDB_G0282133 [Chrysoperla carnea]|uniref:putative uncharacterized protein DDB_G0282133 n=1 Tax=Chrysoperla carnea TaxID=189513 RepID=UPI001D076F7F|nr:putative uncharacterized protein DDB_G0282133 [Chrysoperla carnea]